MNERNPAGRDDWPGVSVVIPVRNEANALRNALQSIVAQRYPGEMEVIVADGSDDSGPVLNATRVFPAVHVMRNSNGSAAAGLNLAFDAASHPIVARCDARCTFPPGYLRRAVETLKRTRAVNVGGLQLPVGSTFFERAVAMAMSSLLGSGGARYRWGGPEGSVDTVFLGVFCRDAVLRSGGFDTLLQRNQDYDLNWRLRKAGGTVWFDPGLAVAYSPRRTLGALARQYFDYGRWKRVMLDHSPASLRLRQVLPALLTSGMSVSGLLWLVGALQDWPEVIWAAGMVPIVYVAVLTAGAAVSLVRQRQAVALLLPVVLVTMHLAWGLGFLIALFVRRPDRIGIPEEHGREHAGPARS